MTAAERSQCQPSAVLFNHPGLPARQGAHREPPGQIRLACLAVALLPVPRCTGSGEGGM